MIKNCCYISRGLFRLVGVRSVGWVVRANKHTEQKPRRERSNSSSSTEGQSTANENGRPGVHPASYSKVTGRSYTECEGDYTNPLSYEVKV
jgi:hypothetical protein